MKFILKIAAGLYIVSVLAFSSWSRASEGFYPLNTSEISIGSLNAISAQGVVFEEDGFLYFQTADHTTVIHSNSFALFENSELPQTVYIEGQSLQNSIDQSSLNTVVQITSVDFLDI